MRVQFDQSQMSGLYRFVPVWSKPDLGKNVRPVRCVYRHRTKRTTPDIFMDGLDLSRNDSLGRMEGEGHGR